MGPTALVLLRTSVLYSTYGHETAWTASYEPVRQAVLDTDPDSAAADESFFWIQIPILLLLMKVFYNEAKRGKIGHVRIGIGLRNSGRTSLILQTRGSTGA